MTPEEYEKVTRDIVDSIFKRVEGIAPTQVGCGRANQVRGASGYHHQIDVSVVDSKNLILVECKHWKKRVPVGKVLEFHGRITDIKPAKDVDIHGVIVSPHGFQSGAWTVAEHFGIDLQFVRSADEFGFAYKKLLLIQP
ncbi:MAG: restriction endonuclease, partial [Cryomorphaceae bacterium]|nr:restriction endonuclease [Cryomorphaceae bacterium]